MPARAQAGRGLEHLVHRAGVELVELENLENLHRSRLPVPGCQSRSPVTGNRHLATVLALSLALACTTDSTRRDYLRNIAETYGPPPRPVIIVPGFGVTRLYDPEAKVYVWGTPGATVHTHYEDDLDLPFSGHDRLIPKGYVGSRGPVNIGWQLMEGLRKFGRYEPGKNVFGFEYDFRLSARENAVHLGQLVDRVRGDGKVDIVTHSAGAIVGLTYVKLAGGGAHVDHLILIAATEHGVADAFRVMVRPERFLRRVLTAKMVATWPFVFELLPEDGRFLVDEQGQPVNRNLWIPVGWSGIAEVSPEILANAHALREELRRAPVPASVQVSRIAGDCVATARRVLMRPDGTFVFYPSELTENERNLEPALFEPGDGTVPISSAGRDAFTVCDGHQGIAADPSVHRAILRTLREGV